MYNPINKMIEDNPAGIEEPEPLAEYMLQSTIKHSIEKIGEGSTRAIINSILKNLTGK